MKRVAIILLSGLLITGCGVDMGGFSFNWGGVSGPSGPFIIYDSNNVMNGHTAINGQVIPFNSIEAGFYFETLSSGNSELRIAGRDNSTSILLLLKNISSPGTYSLGYQAGQVKRIYATFSHDGVIYYSNSDMTGGYVTIDSLSNELVTGTFDIKCWNGAQYVKFTNGYFNCRL